MCSVSANETNTNNSMKWVPGMQFTREKSSLVVRVASLKRVGVCWCVAWPLGGRSCGRYASTHESGSIRQLSLRYDIMWRTSQEERWSQNQKSKLNACIVYVQVICAHSFLWWFQFMAISICILFGLWLFQFVAVSICGKKHYPWFLTILQWMPLVWPHRMRSIT